MKKISIRKVGLTVGLMAGFGTLMGLFSVYFNWVLSDPSHAWTVVIFVAVVLGIPMGIGIYRSLD